MVPYPDRGYGRPRTPVPPGHTRKPYAGRVRRPYAGHRVRVQGNTVVIPPVTDIVVDNDDAGFSVTDSWWYSTWKGGYYGSGIGATNTGTGSNTATWEFSIPQAGSWEVFVWYVDAADRASNAPFTINHAGTPSLVTVDQRVNGGGWFSLGTYSFDAGPASIMLTDNANGKVIADAIKLVYTP